MGFSNCLILTRAVPSRALYVHIHLSSNVEYIKGVINCHKSRLKQFKQGFSLKIVKTLSITINQRRGFSGVTDDFFVADFIQIGAQSGSSQT